MVNDIVSIDAERMIDGRGGPPVEPARVVIQGERITAAGPPTGSKRRRAPAGFLWEPALSFPASLMRMFTSKAGAAPIPTTY